MRLTEFPKWRLASAVALGIVPLACISQQAASPRAESAGDLSGLSDEFDKAATLSNWQRVEKLEGWNNNQLEQFDIGSTQAGWMTMMPYTSVWYQDYRGILAYKNVTGDFVCTTRLRVSRRGGGGAPQSQFSLAGIMVRVPRTITPAMWRPGGENYVFLSTGAADQPGTFQFEVKTTINSDSQLQITPSTGGEAIIRVARVGPYLIMMKNVGGTWTVHRRYTRTDFPSTLQVGLTCYTDWPNASQLDPYRHNGTVIRTGNPDLVAQFDYVRYTRPPSVLLNRRLDDPGSISDAQILQAFNG